MIKVIWKYAVAPYFVLDLPEDAEVLTVQLQNGQPVMWVKLDPQAPCISRPFVSIATGSSFNDEGAYYIGTFQVEGLVFHVFEVRNG